MRVARGDRRFFPDRRGIWNNRGARGRSMRFRVLGGLEATVDGQPVALGGRRQRAVLAVLLLHANELVAADRLVEEAWSGRPPAAAIGTLQTYISRLRRVLEGTGAVITT